MGGRKLFSREFLGKFDSFPRVERSFFFNYPRKDGSLYVRGEFFGRFVNAARLSCDFNFGETRHTRCGYCRRQDGRGEIKR